MTIEQKARELLERNFILPTAHQIGLVEIGIIEGLEMALATSQEVIDDMRCSDETDLRTAKFRVATAIRALIGEMK